MPAFAATLALEFEVLMARAARQGQLPLTDLLDTYTALMAAGRDEPGKARQLDLTRVVSALMALPKGLLHAQKVLLVPDLKPYTYTPEDTAPGLRSGTLADGTWLGEATSYNRLFEWAAHLCALASEGKKVCVLAPGMETSLGELAFALGHDEQTLERANSQTHGELLKWLRTAHGVPPNVRLHASFDPAWQNSLAERYADKVVRALAESGLMDRPLHVWLGSSTLTDCLSPYCRELRPVLIAWARQNPQHLGEDLQALPQAPTEEYLYAIAADFFGHDPRLRSERHEADRTVGIFHHNHRQEQPSFELVDMGRIDPQLCDIRLPRTIARGHQGAALLRLGHVYAPQVVRALTQAVGGRIASITVAAEGLDLGGQSTQLRLPHLTVRWGGGAVQPLPNDGLQPSDFIGLTDQPVGHGTVLSAPSLLLALSTHVAAPLQPNCLEVGCYGILEAVQEALWSAKLAEHVELSWLLITSQRVGSGRHHVQTTRAVAAAAVARLRRVLAAAPSRGPSPEASPVGPPISGPLKEGALRTTSWAVRIKA